MKNILKNNNRKENKMNTKIQIQNHMECLGYEVLTQDDKPNSIMCAKEIAPLLLLSWTDSYIMFYAQYEINSIAKSNEANFMSFINKLNSKASSTRYFITETKEIAFEGLYFGEYDKKIFSNFVSHWEYDVIDRLFNEDDTNLYLGDPNQVVADSNLNGVWA